MSGIFGPAYCSQACPRTSINGLADRRLRNTAIEHQRSGGYTVLKRREKGVPGHVIRKTKLLIWKKVLDNETQTYDIFNMIKSEKLNVYTIEQTKVALSNFDDKSYILDDGYTTLSHGHKRIGKLI